MPYFTVVEIFRTANEFLSIDEPWMSEQHEFGQPEEMAYVLANILF